MERNGKIIRNFDAVNTSKLPPALSKMVKEIKEKRNCNPNAVYSYHQNSNAIDRHIEGK